MAIGCIPIPVVIGQDERQRGVRFRQHAVERDRFQRCGSGEGYASLMGRKPAVPSIVYVSARPL